MFLKTTDYLIVTVSSKVFGAGSLVNRSDNGLLERAVKSCFSTNLSESYGSFRQSTMSMSNVTVSKISLGH